MSRKDLTQAELNVLAEKLLAAIQPTGPDPSRPHMTQEDLDAEKRAAAIDEMVRAHREGNVGGPNDGGFVQVTGSGHTEEQLAAIRAANAIESAPQDAPELDENEARVRAMDAQVAAAHGGAVGMTTGVQTSAPATPETKAPARAKTK